PPTVPTWTATEAFPGADSITLAGITEANATIEVFRSRTATAPDITGQAGSDGKFSFGGVAVANGPNFFRVVAVDAAGNTSELSNTFISTAPDHTPPVLTLRLTNDTGTSATDGLTNDPSVTGTVSDASR